MSEQKTLKEIMLAATCNTEEQVQIARAQSFGMLRHIAKIETQDYLEKQEFLEKLILKSFCDASADGLVVAMGKEPKELLDWGLAERTRLYKEARGCRVPSKPAV